jgi:hypothetical protein
MKNSFLLVLLTCYYVASCSSWENRSSIRAAVWADDGSDLAYVYSEWEGKDTFPSGSDIRNKQYKVIRRNESLTEFSEMTSYISGDAVELFYMKTMDYFLVGLQEGDYAMYFLDGTLIKDFKIRFNNPCKNRIGNFQRRVVVPSIDGRFLVRLETTNNCTVEATFFEYANHLDSIRTVILPFNDFSFVAWTNPYTIVIDGCGEYCGTDLVSLQIFGEAEKLSESIDYSACFYVQTSSSYIRADGKTIDFSKNKIEFGKVGEGYFKDLNTNPDYYKAGCNVFLNAN